ncbi:universal stress protein [Pseudonocardia adelaidensis]|uniref:Universal stress protein n=1 Tax=Pseudonocardia adelaidensis TaxID=648754 RepID=A0ABP9P6Z7_9PSEU
MVGIDGSENSKDALRWAAQQAELTDTTLSAVVAWQVPVSFGTVWQMPATYGKSHDLSQVDFPADARKTLDAALEEVLGANPQVSVTPQLVSGHPAPVLIEASRHAALLVVGRSGLGGFAGMLIGSVSQHCVSHAACPVVVVHRTAEPH